MSSWQTHAGHPGYQSFGPQPQGAEAQPRRPRRCAVAKVGAWLPRPGPSRVPGGGGSCQARACPGGSLGSSSALPTHPRSSSGGSEARGTEGINLKVYTPRVVYIKPNLFRASSSDMLAAALRACLSAGLLGRSLPLIAMSLSLLGTAGGRRERDYIVGSNRRAAGAAGSPGWQSLRCSARRPQPAAGGADPQSSRTLENRVRRCDPPEPLNGVVIYLWVSMVPPARRTQRVFFLKRRKENPA